MHTLVLEKSRSLGGDRGGSTLSVITNYQKNLQSRSLSSPLVRFWQELRQTSQHQHCHLSLSRTHSCTPSLPHSFSFPIPLFLVWYFSCFRFFFVFVTLFVKRWIDCRSLQELQLLALRFSPQLVLFLVVFGNFCFSWQDMLVVV